MATYYILPTGNDSTGNGTSGNPWATISKAFTSSSAGDTIFCLAGTYTWASQTFSGQRIIQGAALANGLPTAIFDDGGGSHTWTFSATGSIINNIAFQNNIPGGANTGTIINSNSTGTLTLNNCSTHNISYTANYGNFFAGTPSNNGTINVYTSLFYDMRNTIGGLSFCGIAGGGDAWIQNFNMYGCDVYFSGVSPIHVLGRANGHSGSARTALFKNNIFYTATGKDFTGFAADSTITYTGSVTNLNFGFTNVPAINIISTSDPLFVDASNANFNLRPGSPAVDVGTL